MYDMTISEARKIVVFVEDEDGRPRLDNLVREHRYRFAKGIIAGWQARGAMDADICHLNCSWKSEADIRALDKKEEKK